MENIPIFLSYRKKCRCPPEENIVWKFMIQSVADEEAYATLSEITKNAAKNNTKKSLKVKSNLTIFMSYTQRTSQTSYYKR
jgi:hypothetical protein